MTQYKTPGVYVEEENSFGTSIVANETAIPVFIGFTQKLTKSNGEELNIIKGSDSVREPVMVSSMLEYEQTFGSADLTGIISIKESEQNSSKSYEAANLKENSAGVLEAYVPGFMYPSVSNFFANGGGSCYIVSIGSYDEFDVDDSSPVVIDFIKEAILSAEKATLILPTDLIRYGAKDYYKWGTQFVDFCGKEKKYFCVLDVIQNSSIDPVFNKSDINEYREAVNSDSSSYSSAYFPYLESLTSYAYAPDFTNIVLDGNNIGTRKVVEYKFSGSYTNGEAALYTFTFASQEIMAPIITAATLSTTGNNSINIDSTTNKLAISFVKGSSPADLNAIWSGMSENYPEWSLNFLMPLEEDGTINLIQNGVWLTASDQVDPIFPFVVELGALHLDAASGVLVQNIASSIVVGTDDVLETTITINNKVNPITAQITIPRNKTASEAATAYNSETSNNTFDLSLTATDESSEEVVTELSSVLLKVCQKGPNDSQLEEIKTFLASNYINMPPSPFMAGIYSRLDDATGVWTPPANTSPVGVTGPLVSLTSQQQEGLNVDAVAGKSINAIRSFRGIGTLVWGARTNDGNSLDWRYVNVRRLFISLETDISMALEAYVFKPNVHNTWVEVKAMIDGYLFGLFNEGAFAGITPETSYQVLIGIGETMSEEDVLKGCMKASVMVAPVRPAEFITLTFSQMIGV